MFARQTNRFRSGEGSLRQKTSHAASKVPDQANPANRCYNIVEQGASLW